MRSVYSRSCGVSLFPNPMWSGTTTRCVRDERRDEVAVQVAPRRLPVQTHDRLARALVDVVHAEAGRVGEVRRERPRPVERLVRSDHGNLRRVEELERRMHGFAPVRSPIWWRHDVPVATTSASVVSDRRSEHALPHRHRQLVAVGAIPERAGHPAATRVRDRYLEIWNAFQCCDGQVVPPQRALMTVRMEQRRCRRRGTRVSGSRASRRARIARRCPRRPRSGAASRRSRRTYRTARRTGSARGRPQLRRSVARGAPRLLDVPLREHHAPAAPDRCEREVVDQPRSCFTERWLLIRREAVGIQQRAGPLPAGSVFVSGVAAIGGSERSAATPNVRLNARERSIAFVGRCDPRAERQQRAEVRDHRCNRVAPFRVRISSIHQLFARAMSIRAGHSVLHALQPTHVSITS